MCILTDTHHDSRRFIFDKGSVLFLCPIDTHIHNFKSRFIYEIKHGIFLSLLSYIHYITSEYVPKRLQANAPQRLWNIMIMAVPFITTKICNQP